MMDIDSKKHYPWNDRIWKQLTEKSEKPSSLLLFGKQGVGKQRLCIEYALSLLSENGKHDNVFNSGNHPDLHVLMTADEVQQNLNESDNSSQISDLEWLAHYGMRYADTSKKTKSITVEQIRQLIIQVTTHSQLSKHKVILITKADKMTVSAANALLKTLEEPPKNTTFVLLCTQAESLPITIRSRCIKHHFRTPNKEIGIDWLKKQGIHQHAESYIMMAGKSPLLAERLAENNEMEKLREIFSSINLLWRGEISTIKVAQAWQKFELNDCIDHLQKHLLDVLKLKLIHTRKTPTNIESVTDLFYPVQQTWTEKVAQKCDLQSLTTTIDELTKIKKLSKGPTDKQLLLENTAISFANLAQTRL